MSDSSPRIIAFAGALRADSNNKKLARAVAAGAEAAGAEVRILDLKDYPLPVYDADLFDAEAGDPHALADAGGSIGGPHKIPMPEPLLRLKEQFQWADGWIISTPEYLRSYPGGLKNMFEWLSRLAPGEKPMDNFTYKVAAIVCACYETGGATSVANLRALISGLECFIVPSSDIFYIHENLFDENGQLSDEMDRRRAEATGRRLVRTIRRFKQAG